MQWAILRRAAGILAVAAISMAAAEPMKVPLQDTSTASTDAALRPIEVWGMLEPRQGNGARGLEYTIVLVNRSATSLSILDPAERSQPELLTPAGWPVALPPEVPSWRIHAPERREPRVVTLEPGKEHHVRVVVDRILTDQKHLNSKLSPVSGEGETALSRLPAGEYKLRMRVALISASAHSGKPAPARMLQSEAIAVTVE
jgi:hypothetical protein